MVLPSSNLYKIYEVYKLSKGSDFHIKLLHILDNRVRKWQHFLRKRDIKVKIKTNNTLGKQ